VSVYLYAVIFFIACFSFSRCKIVKEEKEKKE
jgi:uncharacterized membrane protein